jgi:hypothetical protein
MKRFAPAAFLTTASLSALTLPYLVESFAIRPQYSTKLGTFVAPTSPPFNNNNNNNMVLHSTAAGQERDICPLLSSPKDTSTTFEAAMG